MSGPLSGVVTSGSIALLLVALPPGTQPPSQPTVQARAAIEVEPAAAPVPRRRLEPSPYPRVSAQHMLDELTQLTSIGADGLWRTSGSAGERQAFVWLRERLGELHRLPALGAEVERQTFRIPLATEVWEARLELERGGIGHAVPVHAMQGHRETLSRTLRFDTDGQPNDTARNPIQVDAVPTIIRSYNELRSLRANDLEGRVALVDYAVFDRGLVDLATAQGRAAELLGKRPAAVVLITSYSNQPGEAHGSFVGDVSGFAYLDAPAPVPMAFTRLEDLGPAGIGGWPDLGDVSKVTLRLDVDVLAPGESELTCLHIPGQTGDRVVILGAHLDSPNSPGALDDGSGSVALLEAARALDSTGRRPPVDTTMCWFGSEERGLYGSSEFVLSHQELVDRA
ncbi:MAG TPA: M28 family peptidase, partial [Thermoanaerobaculaceae bacterium]|nr:M28 family peptidase [Thermoanaerobaculaceae bacterium]